MHAGPVLRRGPSTGSSLATSVGSSIPPTSSVTLVPVSSRQPAKAGTTIIFPEIRTTAEVSSTGPTTIARSHTTGILTEATTSVPESAKSRRIITGTTEGISGKTSGPGSATTEATSSPERPGTTGTALKTAATTSPGETGTTGVGTTAGVTTGVPGSKTETSRELSTTTTSATTTTKKVVAPDNINSEPITFSATSETVSVPGAKTSAPGSRVSDSQISTKGVVSGTTVVPESPITGTTSGASSTQVTESKSGTTRVTLSQTTTSGSSTTGATTGTSVSQETGSTIGTTGRVTGTTYAAESPNTVTTRITVGTTVAPGSSNTRATTSTEVSAATEVSRVTGSTGTTASPGSIQTETTVFKEDVGTTKAEISSGTTVVSSRITGTSGSPPPDTSKETSETTTAPGITTTGCPGTLPPAPVCHGPLGEEKSPGDTWSSNCHQCTCTDAKAVDCQPKECPSPPTCKTGEKLTLFKSNDTCCEIGRCEPRTCLYNNTDYEIGASFNDPSNPCLSYSCTDTGLTATVQNCPKQTWCAEKERTYDENKCCYKCNTDCRPSPVNVTVNYNNCKKKVEMARCLGECKKTIRYNYDLFQLENSCLCCREENYEYREIALDCPDGSTLSYRYRHTTTCSCADLCQNSQTSATR
ncbi:PREDICTED: apomucin-like [Chinchilla lanigera]|uniref:apomucin-like n=1 Tax=Chinchilla lanigera TaxID=34839 RepID=UPI00038E9524|nr:PREDICTED: apomucin-like [Chinchilla lanigera]